jgi:hypothetical protein
MAAAEKSPTEFAAFCLPSPRHRRAARSQPSETAEISVAVGRRPSSVHPHRHPLHLSRMYVEPVADKRAGSTHSQSRARMSGESCAPTTAANAICWPPIASHDDRRRHTCAIWLLDDQMASGGD